MQEERIQHPGNHKFLNKHDSEFPMGLTLQLHTLASACGRYIKGPGHVLHSLRSQPAQAGQSEATCKLDFLPAAKNCFRLVARSLIVQ